MGSEKRKMVVFDPTD